MAGAGTFDATARRGFEQDLRQGRSPCCPFCGIELKAQPVEPSAQVSYVRRRLWVLCPACRRSATIDRPAAGPTG
jgi:hypothetical protein